MVKKNLKIGFMQGRLVGSENKNFIQFFPEKNWKRELSLAKKNKLRLIELTANISNLNKNPVFNSRLKNKYKIAMNKNKVTADSLTCDFFMEKPFFKLNNKSEFKSKSLLERVIKVSQNIGIKKFVIPLVDNSSIKSAKEEEKIISYFKSEQFLKNLNKNTLILFESDFKPKKLLSFIKKFNSKIFGINYDSGNSASLNYKIKDEKVYFKYVKNIHIKDRFKFGKTVDLGKGNAQIEKLTRLIKKKKYYGNLILQTAIPEKNIIQRLLKNKQYLEYYL